MGRGPVEREWRLEDIPDREIIDLAASAWNQVAELFCEVATKLGAKVKVPTLELIDADAVRLEVYSPEWVKKNMKAAKEQMKKS